MIRKGLASVAVAVAMMAVAAGPAWAGSGIASGSGTLHDGGTFGFTAKADLTGEIEYHSPDGTLNVHCWDLRGWSGALRGTHKYPDAGFGSSNCSDPQGNAYRVTVDAMDRGEGANARQDRVSITVRSLPDGVVLVDERGAIQNGNVQIQL
jgi:hypothetical protein